MPVREGPIAVWGDQVQVVLCWWWLVAALVEVGVVHVILAVSYHAEQLEQEMQVGEQKESFYVGLR